MLAQDRQSLLSSGCRSRLRTRAQVDSDSSLIEFVDFVPAERGTFDFATLRARKFHKWAIKSNKAVTV